MNFNKEIFLIEFDNNFFFSNGNEEIKINDKIYLPILIENPIFFSNSFNNSHSIKLKFINKKISFEKIKNIRIFLYSNSNINLIYRGFLTSIVIFDNIIDIECISIIGKLSTSVGNFFSNTCRANLGDSSCKIDLIKYEKEGKIIEIISQTKIFGNHAFIEKGYYDLGFIIFNNEKIKIIKENSGIIEFLKPIQIELNSIYKIYPGCNKTKINCKKKFNNIINFSAESF